MIVFQILWLTILETKSGSKIKWQKFPCQRDNTSLDGF